MPGSKNTDKRCADKGQAGNARLDEVSGHAHNKVGAGDNRERDQVVGSCQFGF